MWLKTTSVLKLKKNCQNSRNECVDDFAFCIPKASVTMAIQTVKE